MEGLVCDVGEGMNYGVKMVGFIAWEEEEN